MKRHENLCKLKKKLEIETPDDIPDIVDEIVSEKTIDNANKKSEKQINGTRIRGIQNE